MSEYFYHKGILNFNSSESARKFYDDVIDIDYVDKNSPDSEFCLVLNNKSVSINTVDMASNSLSVYDNFNKLLQKYLPELTQSTTIETYVFGKGYSKILLDTKSKDISYNFVSEKDPYDKPTEIGKGESSLDRSKQDVISQLMKIPEIKELKIDRASISKIINAYYSVVQDYIVHNDIVHTPFGQLQAVRDSKNTNTFTAVYISKKELKRN